MRVIIVAGGRPDPGDDWRRWVREGDLVVGADGGAAQALAWGLVPDLVVGDMDSLAAEDRLLLEAAGSRFVVHPRAKDETDLELAVSYAAEQGAEEIIILAALGGRLDHTLANLLLLALPQLAGRTARIVNGREEALLIRGGESVVLDGRPGDLVSLLPLGGEARGVTTAGLVWALQHDLLRFAFSRGVSNEMACRQARVEVLEGFLWVIHTAQDEC